MRGKTWFWLAFGVLMFVFWMVYVLPHMPLPW